MSFNVSENLISKLRDLHTEIVGVFYESESYTDPIGRVFENMPSFVRVALVSRPGEGSYIQHEVWLPDGWNGCFLGLGNGGMAGSVLHGNLSTRVRQLYAVANTDLGTSRGRDSGVNNPDLIKDFGWRATYLMTKAGKLITEEYYGRPIERSYFFGVSTGGQQSLMLAQRFPEEYDGISVGVPANNRTNLHLSGLWILNAFRNGNVRFEESQFADITKRAVEYSKRMGTSDPEDLFVSRPRGDREYIEGFLNDLRSNLSWITEEHISVLDKIYSGPVDSRTGERIYSGFPIGAEGGLMTKQNATLPRYTFTWVFGADYTGEDFDFGDDLDRMHSVLSKDLDANDSDLTPFFNRGGKLFMYAGSADPVNPFPDFMKYYDRVAKAVGGMDKLLENARFFLIPGQNHGAAVTKFDKAVMNGAFEFENTLDILRAWCEKGTVPEYFDIVTRVGETDVHKRIYSYGTENFPSRDYPSCSEKFM